MNCWLIPNLEFWAPTNLWVWAPKKQIATSRNGKFWPPKICDTFKNPHLRRQNYTKKDAGENSYQRNWSSLNVWPCNSKFAPPQLRTKIPDLGVKNSQFGGPFTKLQGQRRARNSPITGPIIRHLGINNTKTGSRNIGGHAIPLGITPPQLSQLKFASKLGSQSKAVTM